ncbi:Internalin-J precursor [Chryseobacterium nakagawai]|uniref:T9SS C-terminal target domain-containing protein n=1 Tax=Chryseobacterium nakagawai TaxID=1241982 RepID=A0AAD1DSC5_CHRNA|nr:T9SS type A sorting domain-containing protein [Chryseobacterium nakagawai]AZA92646.1 T9SS C-terminal target domain-containing protein [Chryseobacterium nakagawai]VEH19245.1 Internalin-J precursor [Chryseobacterium nakagawai]
MKKIYLVLLMTMFSALQAQIVTIPDVKLKNKLLSSTATNNIAMNSTGSSIKIDANNDGEIQLSEALAVEKLNVESSAIVNISGLEAFSNVKELNLMSNNLISASLSFPELKSLNISSNYLTSINITNCPLLQSIDITSNNLSTQALTNNSLVNLYTGGHQLQHLNLQGIPAVKKVLISYSNLETINAANMPFLEELEISNASKLSQLNLSGSLQLKSLAMQYTGLINLDLTNLTGLKTLEGNNNKFQTAILDGCTALSLVRLENCFLTSMSINNLPLLSMMYLSNNKLTSVVLNNLYGLQHFECYSNQLTNLTINNAPNLITLYASNNKLTALNLSTATNIETLWCSSNNLLSLDVSMLTNLTSLQCTENLFTELDFSKNKAMQYVACSYNHNLQKIFLKNGTSQAFILTHLFPNPSLAYICCDENEINYFNANNVSVNNGKTEINSYCSFNPGGTFYTIQGNVKVDGNNNGCDTNDANKALQKFIITGGSNTGTAIANTTGNFSIPVQAGTHTVTPVLENPTYFNISPTNFTVSFPQQASPFTQNFCITPNGVHNDLETVIIPVTDASPGFESTYKIIYKNKGTTTQSGNLIFTYNDNLMDYMSATLSPSSQSSGTLNWNFTNLQPFETKEIIFTVKLNTPTQTPALNGGDILHYTAQINGATDDTPADNNFVLNQTVVNSFDPNDKTCLEGAAISKTQVGDYVHYLIRFENTGTANARNIVVKDEIDISKFDISSLVPLNGSHSYVTRITDPNVIEFIFENIQLPFDDANNDGYISFKIKTKSTLAVGNSFSNTAKIYFDYNFPIVTNTYTTSVMGTLTTSEIKNDKNTISIYPNPVKDILYIQSANEVSKAVIYDATGRVITSMGTKGNSVPVSDLPKGNYLIKLFLQDKVSAEKFIKE